jgi:hypothetical protein
MGDWVEIGNEVFMNFIAAADIRYRTTTNYDFEDRVMDGVATRSPTSSNLYAGEGDFSQVEARLGVDMRYQKNLTMQVLAEAQYIIDGNLIDDRHNTSAPGANPSVTGIAGSTENNGFHIERYWIDYAFPGTPLRIRVGADLWSIDPAFLVRDDDPRFAVFATFGPNNEIELSAAAVIQREAARLGLQNDNDNVYYTFSFAYNMKPHRIGLSMAYFRDRFEGASGQPNPGQKIDSVLLMPHFTTTVGPIRALLEGAFVLGSADGDNLTDCSAGAGVQRCEYDIFAWAVVAYAEARLLNGMIRPFLGLIYGSGDDDPNDDDLGGYFSTPQPDANTAINSTPYFGPLLYGITLDSHGPAAPARAAFAGGPRFRKTSDSAFADRIGNTAHPGILTAYSNPGTLMIPVGVRIAPLKGHEITPYYLYLAFTDVSTLLQAAADAGTPVAPGRTLDASLYHELGLVYNWVINPHFDILVAGAMIIPSDGVHDIARTQDCSPATVGLQPCEGEDLALKAEVRFRGRF